MHAHYCANIWARNMQVRHALCPNTQGGEYPSLTHFCARPPGPAGRNFSILVVLGLGYGVWGEGARIFTYLRLCVKMGKLPCAQVV